MGAFSLTVLVLECAVQPLCCAPWSYCCMSSQQFYLTYQLVTVRTCFQHQPCMQFWHFHQWSALTRRVLSVSFCSIYLLAVIVLSLQCRVCDQMLKGSMCYKVNQSINSTFLPFPVDKNLINMGLCSSRIGKCPELNFRFTIVGSQIYQGTFCDKI